MKGAMPVSEYRSTLNPSLISQHDRFREEVAVPRREVLFEGLAKTRFSVVLKSTSRN